MKLINSSVQYLPQHEGIDSIYKQVELAGRTSYLSYDKITEDSARKFVDMLIKSKHTSVLEHGAVYLKMPITNTTAYRIDCYKDNFYSKRKIKERKNENLVFDYYITSNLRVLVEHGWLDDLQYLCEPTEFHEKRLSVRVITDIGVTREFNRHRTFSIVEQSTRYCNFSKDKFGNEITFITPSWWKADLNKTYLEPEVPSWHIDEESLEHEARYVWFIESCTDIERRYLLMIKDGMQPQEARTILPLCTKTEAVYTAFESDWRNFFDMRLFGKTGDPHPQMKRLAEQIKEQFEINGLWEGIMKYPSKYV